MFHAASKQECTFLGNHSYYSQKKSRPKSGLFIWMVSYDYWLLTFNSTRLFSACSARVLPLFNGLLGP
jgi:hypothetical protein